MLAGCCCANPDGGDSVDDRRIVQDLPRKEAVYMDPALASKQAGSVHPPAAVSLASVGGGHAIFKREVDCAPAPGALPGMAGSIFNATINRSEDQPIGLDIDLIDGVSAVVVDIKEGAIQSWNEKHPQYALQVNDRIVEVNALRSDANAMVANLKRETTWVLVVQRPREFMVSISRADAPSLGMDLRYAPNGTTLMITQVGDGPMQEWNKANPEKVVCKHDRIIQLNGVRGTPSNLLQASEDSEQLNMLVIHYPQYPQTEQ